MVSPMVTPMVSSWTRDPAGTAQTTSISTLYVALTLHAGEPQMEARTVLLVDFLRYVEDAGLQTYDGLVIQNASDISRESDRVRVQNNVQRGERRREERGGERRRQEATHRLGFMTMPFPQDRAPSLGFSVRSQSLHSVQDEPTNQNHWDPDDPTNQGQWDIDDPTNQGLRKRPPPKPRRNPATKLSSSDIEGFNEGFVGEKLPPPKPQRNPCTQLSSCFDQSQSSNHNDGRPLDQSGEEEPVYIEMGPKPEPDEGVYEEMIFASESSPRPKTVPTPFPNLLSHRAPLLSLPQNAPAQTPTVSLPQALPPTQSQTSPQTSDESPLTPLETALGQFFHQELKKNPRAEARVRRTSDPLQDPERGLFKPEWSHSVDRIRPETRRDPRSQSVDQIHPETRRDPRSRRLDSEPDLRPEQRQYYSLRRDPTGREHKRDLRDPRKGIRVEQRRERSLESLPQDSHKDSDFTVTSSGRASAPPLTCRSGPSPIPHSYRRSQSACPSPVKRPPPYDVIMMSSAVSHGGHMTQRARGSESGFTVRSTQNQVQNQVQNQTESFHTQAPWYYGGLPVCVGAPGGGLPVWAPGVCVGAPGVCVGSRAAEMLMRDTMERKRLLCCEIRRVRRPPPYSTTAPPRARTWDSEI
uniref:Neuronal tyrosine-phosphorylated phosphoinositide-3-kinase adapter N-terminal domain-containing protein n=1 Tax=Knipowitschia caucasica TaxID=637954 RepID=A0AAV2J4W4_KNICA